MGTPLKCLEIIFSDLELNFDLQKGSNQKFIDLGAGDGRVVKFVFDRYGIYCTGIEINDCLVDEAKKQFWNTNPYSDEKKKEIAQRVKLLNADLFQYSLDSFDFIYLFPLPTIQKMLKHVVLTAKKGAIFICYKYKLEELDSILTLVQEERDNICKYFIYKKKEKNN